MALERTLVILKPDAHERGLVEDIVACFEDASLTVIIRKEVVATPEQLARHFPNTEEWLMGMGKRAITRVREELGIDPVACYGTEEPLEVGKIIARGCQQHYASGTLTPLVLEGEDAVAHVRKLIGNTLPSKAAKGTIRGDFGIPEDPEKLFHGAARNLVHASDSVDEARREIAVWFT